MHSLLGKARLILDSFDADSGALSLTELANRSGVAKATVHRIAGELVSLGLLERVGTKYRLGLRLFELGQLVPRQRILREVSLTYVQDLHAATRETVHLAIRDGLDVLYIDKISGHHGGGPAVAGGWPAADVCHGNRQSDTRVLTGFRFSSGDRQRICRVHRSDGELGRRVT